MLDGLKFKPQTSRDVHRFFERTTFLKKNEIFCEKKMPFRKKNNEMDHLEQRKNYRCLKVNEKNHKNERFKIVRTNMKKRYFFTERTNLKQTFEKIY